MTRLKGFETFSCAPIVLNGVTLEFVNEWKYLGVLLVSGNSFICSSKKARSSQHMCANCYIHMGCYCFPLQRNAISSCCCKRRCTKDFSYHRWESIRSLRESLGYQSITDIFAKRKFIFEKRLPQIGNALLSFLARN